MSNNYNNIDDLLRESFDDFSSAPSPAVRAKVSAKIKMFNFWRFNPGSFNIFYTLAVVLGTSSILVFTTGLFSSDNNNNVSTVIIPSQKIVETKTTEENGVTSEETHAQMIKNQTDSEELKNKPNHSFFQTSESNLDMVLSVEDDYSTDNVAVLQSEKSVEDKEIFEENTHIFDTIIETVRITVRDTIKTKVFQTVEIKKRKRNNNR